MKVLLPILFLFYSQYAEGQTAIDTFSIYKKRGDYFYKGRQQSFNQLSILTEHNTAAAAEMRIAANRRHAGGVMKGVGALMMAPLALHLLKPAGDVKRPNGATYLFSFFAVGGLCFITSGTFFDKSVNNHIDNAVELYNKGLSAKKERQVRVGIGFTDSGVGLCLGF